MWKFLIEQRQNFWTFLSKYFGEIFKILQFEYWTLFCVFYQAIIKPQYVDQIPKAVKVSYCFSSSYTHNFPSPTALISGTVWLCFQGSVQSILDRKSEMDNQTHICEQLGMLSYNFNHMQLVELSLCFSLLSLFTSIAKAYYN